MEGCQSNSSVGSLTERDSYRPVSVLPNVSKVHEFFANLDLMRYAQEADLIGEHQYAYVRNLSTTVALIQLFSKSRCKFAYL